MQRSLLPIQTLGDSKNRAYFVVLLSEQAVFLLRRPTLASVSYLKAKPQSTSVSCTDTSMPGLRSECILRGARGMFLISEQTGSRFLVCDAGGSTIDTIAYVVKACRPRLALEEVKASGCKLFLLNPAIAVF